MEMTAQKQRFPSFATTISALGIILYCVGFLRVELELKNQRERLEALENIPETEPPSSDPNIAKFIKVARGMHFSTCSNTVFNFMPSEIVPPILLRTFQGTQMRSTFITSDEVNSSKNMTDMTCVCQWQTNYNT